MNASLILFAGLILTGTSAVMLMISSMYTKFRDSFSGLACWIGIIGCAMTIYYLVGYS